MGNLKSNSKTKTICGQSLEMSGNIDNLTGLKTGAQSSNLSVISGSGAKALNVAQYNDFKLSMTGDTTLSITGAIPTGSRFYIAVMVQSGGFALTWFSGSSSSPIAWDVDTPPDFTTYADQNIVLWTDDAGANWSGKSVFKQ